MKKTTNFDEWLEKSDPDGAEEVYTLYYGVFHEEDNGIWRIENRDGVIYIHYGYDDSEIVLLLKTPEAKRAFLSLIIEKYCDGEDDIDNWYGYKSAMENTHA